jgi:hypothetical protein
VAQIPPESKPALAARKKSISSKGFADDFIGVIAIGRQRIRCRLPSSRNLQLRGCPRRDQGLEKRRRAALEMMPALLFVIQRRWRPAPGKQRLFCFAASAVLFVTFNFRKLFHPCNQVLRQLVGLRA